MHTYRRDIFPVSALALLGSLAFVRLMAPPVFEDEGSQLRLISRLTDGEWLQPLGEGKPLEAWPMLPFLWLAHPLTGIRAVHVLAGIAGVVLTYRLATLLGAGRWLAFTCGALFGVCPYVVYLERMALSDILMCAAGIWVLVSELELLQVPGWRRSAVLATALVLAAGCKLPVGFVFLISMPLALALMPVDVRRRYLHRAVSAKLLAAHGPAILLVLAVAGLSLVRWQRGQTPGFGVQDLVGIGLGGYLISLPRPTLLGELTAQLSWPVVLLGSIGIAASAFAGDWRQRWLIVVAGLPLLAIGLLARFWYSRYLLFTLPPLIVAAVLGWHGLAQRARRLSRVLELGVLAVCLVCLVPQSMRLILRPQVARWSAVDRYQYFEGPGSGYGYPEAADFILRANDVPRRIHSLDGHSAWQLRSYLPATWRARVTFVFFGTDGRVLRSDGERLQNLLTPPRSWLIAPEPLLRRLLESSVGATNAAQLRLRPLAAFDKPGERTRLAIYEITEAN